MKSVFLKDPLLHFLGLGFGLLILFQFTGNQESEERNVLVDRETLLTFLQYQSVAFDREQFELFLDDMSQREIEDLIQEAAREEILYREALALGLDSDDYIIRSRLVQKLRYLSEGFSNENLSISEEDILAYFESNRRNYDIDPFITFTHVFYNSQRRGEEAAHRLAEEKLVELANSIRKNGIIQPIAVREDKVDPGRYEIVAGERRWLAAQKAGLHEVPIVILDLDDNEALEVAIVENIQRDDLNVIEEAKGYKRLSEEFGYDHEKIANFMSKSRSHISNTLRLLTLPKDVIGLIEEGNLTAGQARPLIGMPSATNIAEEIVAKNLSARSVELLVRAKKGPQKSGRMRVDSNILNEQNKIQENLGLNVNIQNKKDNSGKITIEYKNLDQFELLSDLLTKH